MRERNFKSFQRLDIQAATGLRKVTPRVTIREQAALDDSPPSSLATSAVLCVQRSAAFPRRGTPEQAPPWRSAHFSYPRTHVPPYLRKTTPHSHDAFRSPSIPR